MPTNSKQVKGKIALSLPAFVIRCALRIIAAAIIWLRESCAMKLTDMNGLPSGYLIGNDQNNRNSLI